jgi:DNA-binding transcriptional LysR family regulator
MTPSLKQLDYICAVQESGSYAKAAKKMNISQSSIIAAVSMAEQYLGARIFSPQKGRGVLITAAGERFITSARRLLAAKEEFHRTIRFPGSVNESLRIGLFEPFSSIIMTEVLRRLKDEISDISVELIEADQLTLKRCLDQGEVDVLLVYDLGPDFSGSVEHIGRAPPHAMVHKDNALARHDAISISQLAEEPISLLSLPLTTSYLMSLFDAAIHRPRIVFKSRNYETVIRSVANGLGATVLNAWPRHALQVETNTKRLHLTDRLPAPNIVTVDHYGEMRPRAVKSFIAILKEYFAEAYRY